MKQTLSAFLVFLGLWGGGALAQETWGVYFTLEGDTVLSVRYNSHIASRLSDVAERATYTVTVAMKTPKPNGLRAAVELGPLADLEDALAEVVIGQQGDFLGARTGASKVEMVFETRADGPDLRSALKKVVKAHGYDGFVERIEDHTRYVFRSRLVPDALERVRQQTHELLIHLQRHGDTLAYPRQITHAVYFENPEEVAAFAEAMRRLGFGVEEQAVAGDVRVLLHHDIVPEFWALSQLVYDLGKEATKFGGDYDGWETIAVP